MAWWLSSWALDQWKRGSGPGSAAGSYVVSSELLSLLCLRFLTYKMGRMKMTMPPPLVVVCRVPRRASESVSAVTHLAL